jgi:hypothetical protein
MKQEQDVVLQDAIIGMWVQAVAVGQRQKKLEEASFVGRDGALVISLFELAGFNVTSLRCSSVASQEEEWAMASLGNRGNRAAGLRKRAFAGDRWLPQSTQR